MPLSKTINAPVGPAICTREPPKIETKNAEIIAEVKSKLEFARDEYNYWCDEAKREDEEMKIYQQQYYEEEERIRREAAEEEARRKREAS